MERNIKLILVMMLIGIIGIGSVAVVQQMNIASLDAEYQVVLSNYSDLDSLYQGVTTDYTDLMKEYEDRISEYDALNVTYTTLLSTHGSLAYMYEETIESLLAVEGQLLALNTTYLALLADLASLNLTYYLLTGEYDALNESYNALLEQYNLLNGTYYGTLETLDEIQEELDGLTILYEALVVEHNILQAEYDALLADYDALVVAHGILQDDYNQLQSDFNNLQNDYDNLWVNYNTLWVSYNSLQSDYDELVDAYNTLDLLYVQLQLDYSDLHDDYLILQAEYDALDASYWILYNDFDQLQIDYSVMYNTWQDLVVDYDLLNANYDQLQSDYDTLNEAFTIIGDWLSQQILPVKALYFGESVRRHYLPIYLEEAWNQGLNVYWTNFTKYMADVIYFSSAWRTDSDSGHGGGWGATAHGTDLFRFGYVRDTLYPIMFPEAYYEWPELDLGWKITRNIWGYSGWMEPVWNNGTHDVEIWWGDVPDSQWSDYRWECPSAIHQWVVDNIDYEYDSAITKGQTWSDWDYIKFPVETAFRTLGDCEDQAILDASFLRACGFQVAIGILHDDAHPTIGNFHHAVLWINMDFNDDGDHLDAGEDPLGSEIWWTLKGSPSTWICLDPTWDVSFGMTPGWLQDYIDHGISSLGSDKLHVEILTAPL